MENRKIKSLAALGIVALLVITLVWFQFGLTGQSTNETTIEIGVITTSTGVGAFVGQESLKGYELARDQLNGAGGINGKKVKLIFEDSGTDPKKSVNAMNKLVHVNKVDFVLGDSWSSTTVPIVPIANAEKVVLISPIAILDDLEADDMFFRTVPKTNDMMKELANYAYYEIGSRKIAILMQATPFGFEHARDFKTEFESLGGKVVLEESFVLTQADLHAELTKAQAKNPDTILNVHATGPKIGSLVKQAKELGIEVNWISHFGAESGPLIQQYGDVLEGLVYPFIYDNANKMFVDKHMKKYGGAPNFISANSYDALMVLAKALENTDNETPLEVKEELLKIKNFNGGSGVLSFDKNGDVRKPVFIKKILSGKFVRVN
jgi:branched-chain amino acid transport system substrate-binding protein